MTYSKLDEEHPNPENPFDFRPPKKLPFKTLGRLYIHIVRGLKIETEQGIETVQALTDRVYEVIRRMEFHPEADPEPEVQTLPECIRESVYSLIRTVRANLTNLKNIKGTD